MTAPVSTVSSFVIAMLAQSSSVQLISSIPNALFAANETDALIALTTMAAAIPAASFCALLISVSLSQYLQAAAVLIHGQHLPVCCSPDLQTASIDQRIPFRMLSGMICPDRYVTFQNHLLQNCYDLMA